MIVLDTHTLLWWGNDPSHLSAPAQEAIEAGMRSNSISVSCISSWEIALLVQHGRLWLTLDVRDWLYRFEKMPFVSFVPVSNAVAVESVRLPDFPHDDPADKIITATAMTLGAALVTKDERLQGYSHLRTIW